MSNNPLGMKLHLFKLFTLIRLLITNEGDKVVIERKKKIIKPMYTTL